MSFSQGDLQSSLTKKKKEEADINKGPAKIKYKRPNKLNAATKFNSRSSRQF